MELHRKPLEWDILANELAITSALGVIFGSALGMAQMFPRWQIGCISLICGILVLMLEYPRSCKHQFQVSERRYQQYIVPLIYATGKYGSNYYFRCTFYICLGILCCCLLPTLIGGLCLILTSAIYLKAALCGFEWKPLHKRNKYTEMECTMSCDFYKNLGSLRETVC